MAEWCQRAGVSHCFILLNLYIQTHALKEKTYEGELIKQQARMHVIDPTGLLASRGLLPRY